MTSLDSKLTTANRRFSFTGGGLTEATFTVVEMTGFEALSKPFNFELILVSNTTDVNFDAMLSNPATLTIYTPGGTEGAPYHGVLSEFEQLQEVDTLVFYKAVLVPRIQRLSLYRTSDVFLNDQKIPDVLDTVIKASGLTSGDYEKKTTGSYRARTFVCQYQETNFDFISRWMEKEGMYYYFDHSDGKDMLVIVDDLSMLPDKVLTVTHRPIENILSSNASDSVHSFICRQQPLPKQVILQGFNYADAKVPLEQSYAVSDTGTGDVMLYGENFLTLEEGLRYAKLRAQQILCNGKVFKGEATATGIRSGHLIELLYHYRTDFIGNYLVTEIEHSGSQAGMLLAGITHSFGGKSGETSYRHSFRAIPAGVQFRPECKTKRPYVAGTISAIIDAEGSGQYADLDEFGQYKVQLPFSKSGKAANQGSARIRMASPYAGSNHGMHFPLHKGAEVLLSFMDGDPDQPIIVSAVSNSEHKNVVTDKNPYENKILTAGGNLMHMGDKPEKQAVWLHSPKLNTTVGLGAVASRDVNKDTDASDASKPNMLEKIAAILIPPVSFRISTAGSSETLSGGSNTAASRGRNYVNLQGDSVVTMLGSSRMTYKGIFDWSPQGETSYREDRVAIDRLDNFALANNIIRHAEDTVVVAAGRVKTEQETIKGNSSKAKYIAYTQLALNAALAAKDVVLVNLNSENKDPLKTPGLAKIITSPVFTALNYAASKGIGYFTGKNQQKKLDTFHSNLVVNPNGLDLSTSDQNSGTTVRFTSGVSITRDGLETADIPEGPKFATADWLKSKASNYVFNKPDPLPMGRKKTDLGVISYVTQTSPYETFRTQIEIKNLGILMFAHATTNHGNLTLSPFDFYVKIIERYGVNKGEAFLKLTKDAFELTTGKSEQNTNGKHQLLLGGSSLRAQSGIKTPSKLKLSDEEALLTAGVGDCSKLHLTESTAKLSLGESCLAVTAAGAEINGKLIKLG